jgi:hypothetical protein
MLTVLQSSTTQTSTFTGSAVAVSSLPATGTVLVKVTSLTQGKTAAIQIQSSTDGFVSNIKTEKHFAFVGPTGAVYPLGKEAHEYDMPNIPLGAAAASISAPGTVTPTPSSTGGTLAAHTYFYEVTATNAVGETTASPETSGVTTTGTTSSVALAWASVPGATGYRIYRGQSSGGENTYYTSATNSFTDTGAAGTAGSPPGTNTTGQAAKLRIALVQIDSSASITYEAYLVQ